MDHIPQTNFAPAAQPMQPMQPMQQPMQQPQPQPMQPPPMQQPTPEYAVAVALRHRTTGVEYEMNAAMAEHPDMAPIDANGNEVYNAPLAGSTQTPNAPPAAVAGMASAEQVHAIQLEMQDLRAEVARQGAALHQLSNRMG